MDIPVVVADASAASDALAWEVHAGVLVESYDSPARISCAVASLMRIPGVRVSRPAPLGAGVLEQVHDEELLALLRTGWAEQQESAPRTTVFADTFWHHEFSSRAGDPSSFRARLGRRFWDTNTGLSRHTALLAEGSAASAVTAAHAVGTHPFAVALCRPPGHHASRSGMGGGCYLNNAALASEALLSKGLGRVGILDLDFHHGNGTQAIFWEREDVAYVSVHGDPTSAFPYFSGFEDERGEGLGLGFTRNIALAEGFDAARYRDAVLAGISELAHLRVEALVVSLGLDTLEGDPTGNGRLRVEDQPAIAALVAELDVPTVVVLEGGYRIDLLGDALAQWVSGFARRASGPSSTS